MSAGIFPIAGEDLESPTSTLYFPENPLPIQTLAFNESTKIAALVERSDDAMALQDMTCSMESAWYVGAVTGR
jgi:hypothetical protein